MRYPNLSVNTFWCVNSKLRWKLSTPEFCFIRCLNLIYNQIRTENKVGTKLPQLRTEYVTGVTRILITLFCIYKLAKQKYKWRNRVGQFINLNSVIRILVISVTHPVRNWGNFFQLYFLFVFDCICIISFVLM